MILIFTQLFIYTKASISTSLKSFQQDLYKIWGTKCQKWGKIDETIGDHQNFFQIIFSLQPRWTKTVISLSQILALYNYFPGYAQKRFARGPNNSHFTIY